MHTSLADKPSPIAADDSHGDGRKSYRCLNKWPAPTFADISRHKATHDAGQIEVSPRSIGLKDQAMAGVHDQGGHADRPEILILDDEVAVAREIADGLLDEGYRCTIVHEAAAALALLCDHPRRFAVLVSDIRMPGMDGVTLARRLLDDVAQPSPGIVLLTGHGVPAEVATAFAPGAVQVIRKPFRWDEFMAGLALVLPAACSASDG